MGEAGREASNRKEAQEQCALWKTGEPEEAEDLEAVQPLRVGIRGLFG